MNPLEQPSELRERASWLCARLVGEPENVPEAFAAVVRQHRGFTGPVTRQFPVDLFCVARNDVLFGAHEFPRALLSAQRVAGAAAAPTGAEVGAEMRKDVSAAATPL